MLPRGTCYAKCFSDTSGHDAPRPDASDPAERRRAERDASRHDTTRHVAPGPTVLEQKVQGESKTQPDTWARYVHGSKCAFRKGLT
jgi:hypothetical protein